MGIRSLTGFTLDQSKSKKMRKGLNKEDSIRTVEEKNWKEWRRAKCMGRRLFELDVDLLIIPNYTYSLKVCVTLALIHTSSDWNQELLLCQFILKPRFFYLYVQKVTWCGIWINIKGSFIPLGESAVLSRPIKPCNGFLCCMVDTNHGEDSPSSE